MAAPVVIAGAGPVGLTTALSLAKADIDVVVLEQRPAPAQDARATTVQPPVLEVLDELGVLDALLAQGRKVERLQFWDLANRKPLAHLDLGLLADDTRFPYRLHVAQPQIVATLTEALEAQQPGAVRRSHKVLSFQDRGPDVMVEVEDSGQRVEVAGRFLVGADGVRSTVREALRIEMDAAHNPVGFVSARADLALVDAFQQRLGPGALPVAGASYVLHDDGWALLMQMRDHVRILLPATGSDTTSLSREAMVEQTEAILGTGWGVEMESLALYHVWQRVARTWRTGRALLAGDAAHSAWPVGGTSMNFGMLDAHALAKALRDGSEAALDAYAHGRRAAAERALLSGADALMHVIDPWGMWERSARRRLLATLAADPLEARRHLRQLSLLPVDATGV